MIKRKYYIYAERTLWRELTSRWYVVFEFQVYTHTYSKEFSPLLDSFEAALKYCKEDYAEKQKYAKRISA